MKYTTIFLAVVGISTSANAGDLLLDLRNGAGVTGVGAVRRWDNDGNPRQPINPKAKIDQSEVNAWAKPKGDTWVFSNLESGRYDLVILKKDRIRVEGFHYPPVKEFDPFLPAIGKTPKEEDRDMVLRDLSKGRHNENKVTPLYLAGDDKVIRVLMQLVRDQPTSYDSEVGYAVATVRHEVWQYTFRYGAWTKEKATRVLDRLLLPRQEFSRWTWVWEPHLGGIEVGVRQAIRIAYELPKRFEPTKDRGWYPGDQTEVR